MVVTTNCTTTMNQGEVVNVVVEIQKSPPLINPVLPQQQQQQQQPSITSTTTIDDDRKVTESQSQPDDDDNAVVTTTMESDVPWLQLWLLDNFPLINQDELHHAIHIFYSTATSSWRKYDTDTKRIHRTMITKKTKKKTKKDNDNNNDDDDDDDDDNVVISTLECNNTKRFDVSFERQYIQIILLLPELVQFMEMFIILSNDECRRRMINNHNNNNNNNDNNAQQQQHHQPDSSNSQIDKHNNDHQKHLETMTTSIEIDSTTVLPTTTTTTRPIISSTSVLLLPSVSLSSSLPQLSLQVLSSEHICMYRYLEAVVSLCGRKHDYHTIILETIYYYYYNHNNDNNNDSDSNNNNNKNANINSEHSIESNQTTSTVIPTLSSFLYRLTSLYVDICTNSMSNSSNEMNQHNADDTDTDSNHIFPVSSSSSPEWDAYFASIHNPRISQPSTTTTTCTMIEWKHWVQRYAPMIPVMVSTIMSYIYLSQRPTKHHQQQQQQYEQNNVCIPSEQINVPPWMNTRSDIPIKQLTIMGLGSTTWRSIYQSTLHGLSFTTLTHQLLSYYGPTILIVETTKHEIFGYYTKVPWKVSNRWYTQNTNHNPSMAYESDAIGDHHEEDDDDVDESFLFRLYPFWNVYRPQMESTIIPKRYHQYLNPSTFKNRHNNNPTTLVGLAVGGVGENVPRLHITPSFEDCKACIWDSVFDVGPLLSNNDESYFDIFNLEVWAVTKSNYHNRNSSNECDDIVYEQGKRIGTDRTSTMEHLRQRHAKVDRAQFVDDLIAGTILPNKIFQHRLQTRGRADFVVASDNVNDGYVIDGKHPSPR